MCKTCGCQSKAGKMPAPPKNKRYICPQCHTSKSVKAGEPAPECCGQTMNEVD
jgi:hypothetical protein